MNSSIGILLKKSIFSILFVILLKAHHFLILFMLPFDAKKKDKSLWVKFCWELTLSILFSMLSPFYLHIWKQVILENAYTFSILALKIHTKKSGFGTASLHDDILVIKASKRRIRNQKWSLKRDIYNIVIFIKICLCWFLKLLKYIKGLKRWNEPKCFKEKVF